MKAGRYYEEYWSAGGFHPHGRMTPGLGRLLARYAPTPGTVLDLGCGDGMAVGPWFRDHGWSYVGADVSENAIRAATEQGFEAVTVPDASQLPFAEGQYDLVVCLEVLEHLFSPQDTILEIRRVLKPGGLLIATVPNIAYWRRRVDLTVLGRWNPLGDDRAVDQPWRDPHIRFFNPGVLGRLLRSADLSLVEVGGHGGTLFGDLPWVGRRLRKDDSNAAYRMLERISPSLFAYRVHAVAKKPDFA